MPRRVSLPAADDLFRPSGAPEQGDARERGTAARQLATVAPVEEAPAAEPVKRPSGRVRHDEKMTVYVTADELLDLEHARLSLRRSQGIAVDRGRLVRVAIAMALADLEANGEDSVLVQRLTGD
ncbi:hypothetical protein SAMN04488570_1146 [Nocardioides scoriae]|uniref:Cobyrinic acid a,c-diamide synthase n=1 Tax=Nocardioides scoriae TaxID=642780 RepID=A0A1H1PIB8_9ACTN|nr:hypothetical protein [Nocardioides scoriae]SDS10775.1 hypothetical protein SAMN04488570_1146 [Nocardioides scoriae]